MAGQAQGMVQRLQQLHAVREGDVSEQIGGRGADGRKAVCSVSRLGVSQYDAGMEIMKQLPVDLHLFGNFMELEYREGVLQRQPQCLLYHVNVPP